MSSFTDREIKALDELFHEVGVYRPGQELKLLRPFQFATIARGPGHLYCGHLGTPNKQCWPDHKDVDIDIREFEAESVP